MKATSINDRNKEEKQTIGTVRSSSVQCQITSFRIAQNHLRWSFSFRIVLISDMGTWVLDYCNKANGDHRSPLTKVKIMKKYETL